MLGADRPRPSIRRNSLARLASLLARVAIGTCSAVVTARALGPDAKGTLSSLLFITTLLAYASSLGLGDAATVLAGQRKVTLSQALSASMIPLGLGCVISAVALAATARVADWRGLTAAIVLAAFLIAGLAFVNVASSFMDALERLTLTAVVSVVGAIVALVTTTLFVAVFDLGVLGGVIGALAGAVVMAAVYVVALGRAELHLRPTVDRGYLRLALRLGAVLQATAILGSAADRADLLVVYTLADPAEAGIYTVGLAIGSLAAYSSAALANAIFPRVATMNADEARILLTAAVRVSFTTALLSAAGIVAVAPFATPVLFGDDYRGAIGPAVLIAITALASGPQWTLARAAAARHHSLVYFGTYGTSVLVMLALDAVLVPAHGALGAAWASLLAAIVGLLVAIWGGRRVGLLTLRGLRPQRADLTAVAGVGRALTRELGRRRQAKETA